jgi:hypothetical protein
MWRISPTITDLAIWRRPCGHNPFSVPVSRKKQIRHSVVKIDKLLRVEIANLAQKEQEATKKERSKCKQIY